MRPSLRAGPSRLGASTRFSRPALARASPLHPSPSSTLTPPALALPPSRAFFSLPDISKLANLVPGQEEGSDGDEQRFKARKVLPYTPAQLYQLVSDVPAYAYFLPFCNSSTVLDKAGRPAVHWKPGPEPFVVDAELAVGFGGLEERYISKVVGTPFQSVSATASKSSPLFKSLVSTWSFAPTNSAPPGQAATGPTLLTIDLAFSFANPLHRIASQAVLPKVADKMIEAFEARAHEVWGKKL